MSTPQRENPRLEAEGAKQKQSHSDITTRSTATAAQRERIIEALRIGPQTSNAGAVGGMQILPGTFKEVADKGWSIDDPIENARAGVRYIGKMLERAGGDERLAAVGYYGGPGGMDKARKGQAVSDPRNANAPNTLEYADQVTGRLQDSAQAASWWEEYPEAEQGSLGAVPSENAAPEQADRGFLGQLVRQVGLTARAGAQGVAAIPGIMADAVTAPINAGLDAVQGEGNGYRFPKSGAALDNFLTIAGLPEPENATERVVQGVTAGMAGAGGAIGAGRVLAQSGGRVASGVGETLASGPGLQVGSAATGAGAAGITQEGGGGAGAQVVAGLAGGLAPATLPAAGGAAVRGALRGGAAGRERTADAVRAFEAAGVQPTVGQATGGRMARGAESLLTKVPGGAGVMSKHAQKQADDMAASVQALADELAPNASATKAGEAIKGGIHAFKEGVKDVQQKLYANLDKYIPARAPIAVDKTRAALADLNASIEGAPTLSALFKNAKISRIERALLQDLDNGAQGLPYQAVKKLRTLVGRELADASFVSDVPRSKWKALYGALSDDLGVAARHAGPEAEAAWSWANQYTRDQMNRLEQLSGIVTKDAPEKIFRAVLAGTNEGDTIAKRVIDALPKAERREVAAAVLQRLGRATPGQQNAVGDAFSSETFLTNLSRMSPDARRTLLGRTDLDGVLDMVGQFAKVADARREGGRVFANPSGTAPAAAQMATASGLAGGGVAAALGHPAPLAGALAVPAAANLGARAMTSRRLVDMAATQTTMAPGWESAAVQAAANTANAEERGSIPKDAFKGIAEAESVGEAIEALQPDEQQAPQAAEPALQVLEVPQVPEAPPITQRDIDRERLRLENASAQALKAQARVLEQASRRVEIEAASANLTDDDLTRIINWRSLPTRARLNAMNERARRRKAGR